MISKLLTWFSQPKAFEAAILNYLAAIGEKATKEKVIADMVIYHNLVAVSNKTLTFFEGTPATGGAPVGVANFNRPEGEPMIITRLRFLEGANATLDATAWTEGLSTADVMNGTFNVLVNGVIQMRNIPLTASVEADENPYSGFIELSEPIVWGGQKTINVVANWRVAPATAVQNLRCELWGIGLVS